MAEISVELSVRKLMLETKHPFELPTTAVPPVDMDDKLPEIVLENEA